MEEDDSDGDGKRSSEFLGKVYYIILRGSILSVFFKLFLAKILMLLFLIGSKLFYYNIIVASFEHSENVHSKNFLAIILIFYLKTQNLFFQVVCIEQSDRKRSWFPALGVKHHGSHSESQVFVQSFKDGKRSLVNRDDIKEFIKSKDPLQSFLKGETRTDPVLKSGKYFLFICGIIFSSF